jgi:hypothetical protein
MDLDGQVTASDLEGFVLGLSDADAYFAQFGVAADPRGDMDGDGDLDFDDIDELVHALQSGVAVSGNMTSLGPAQRGVAAASSDRGYRPHTHASVEGVAEEAVATTPKQPTRRARPSLDQNWQAAGRQPRWPERLDETTDSHRDPLAEEWDRLVR